MFVDQERDIDRTSDDADSKAWRNIARFSGNITFASDVRSIHNVTFLWDVRIPLNARLIVRTSPDFVKTFLLNNFVTAYRCLFFTMLMIAV